MEKSMEKMASLWHFDVVQYTFWQSFSDLIVIIIGHYNWSS